MKRITAIFLSVLLLLLSACAPLPESDGRLRIVCTVFPAYDLARSIAGERAEITMLLPPGAEAHSYEPTAQDLLKLENCELFLFIGGENDTWVEELTQGLRHAPALFPLLDHADTYREEEPNGEPSEEGEPDEHVWTSPEKMRQLAAALCQTLCEKDPAGEAEYRRAAAEYDGALADLSARLRETVETAARREIVVADRFPFLYLIKDYGLTYYAAFPGCGHETEPSAATMAALCDRVRESGIPAVLYVEFSTRAVADALAETCSVQTRLLHSCHNVSREELAAGVTYLSLMEENIKVLSEVLNEWN